MSGTFDPEYPRPLLRRPDWTRLDGPWRFLEDPEDRGRSSGYPTTTLPDAEQILVPFPPESAASGLGRDVADVIWYQREFDSAPPGPGRRRLLHFEAVDYRADVWLNGQHIGGHEGGQTRFSFDITEQLRDGTNLLTLRVHDAAGDLEQPRGKQDWLDEPHVIWYRRSSGIWRTVWSEEVADAHIADVHFVTTAAAAVEATISLAGRPQASDQVRLTFRHGGETLAESTHLVRGDRVETSIAFSDTRLDVEPEELLWSPERPNLIDVEIELLRGGQVLDGVDSYLGLRTVATDDRAVLLNNRPYFLRMVLEQGYWPESQLSAPSADALRAEAELIKQLGFNGLRVHQKSADPRFLAWCDRIGLLVWADTAASYRFTDRAFRRLTTEWAELVTRDRGHPSVVAWVAFNESWGVPRLEHRPEQRWAVRAIHAMIKTLDPSRLVIGNDGWEHVVGDVVGVHDYVHDPRALEDRFSSLAAARSTVREGRTGGRRILLEAPADTPVLLSEFGGINLHSDDRAWTGYGDASNEEEFVEHLGALVAAVGPGSGLAGYCYTQLTDTAQEQNGLAGPDREPKVPIERLRRIFGPER